MKTFEAATEMEFYINKINTSFKHKSTKSEEEAARKEERERQKRRGGRIVVRLGRIRSRIEKMLMRISDAFTVLVLGLCAAVHTGKGK